MKKVLGFVVILAALMLSCYYGMGVLTERTFKKNIEVLNEVDSISVSLDNYQRGLFKSTVVLNWKLTIPARSLQINNKVISEPEKNYAVQMPVVIYHGPIIVADSKLLFGLGYAHSQITLPTSYDALFNSKYTATSTKPSFVFSVFVSYLNNTSINVEAPKFTLIAKQGKTQLEWLGLDNQLQISSIKKQIDGHLMINGLSWIQDNVQGMIKKIESEYQLRSDKNFGFYLRDAHLSLPLIQITQDNNKLLEINQFDAKTHNRIHQGLFDALFNVSLNELLLDQHIYRSCAANVAIRNLNLAVLAVINDKIAKVKQVNQNGQYLMFSILSDLPQLVNKGAQFEISNLSVSLQNGQVHGNLFIEFPKEDMTNPFQLIQKTQGNGRLLISMPILKDLLKNIIKQRLMASIRAQQNMVEPSQSSVQNSAAVTPPEAILVSNHEVQLSAEDVDKQAQLEVDQKIARLVKIGLLLPQGLDYKMEFKISNGQLFINGSLFNPALLQ